MDGGDQKATLSGQGWFRRGRVEGGERTLNVIQARGGVKKAKKKPTRESGIPDNVTYGRRKQSGADLSLA